MNRDDVNETMTPAQVAEVLHLGHTVVDEMIRRNELPSSRVGGSYAIARSDVDAYLVAHSTDPLMRQALFDRALSPARWGYPDGDSDTVLAELEQNGAERSHRRSSA